LHFQPSRPTDPLSAEDDRTLPASDAIAPTRPNAVHKDGQNNFLSKLSIANKIIWGYGISLGIAVLGTATGLLVGNHYQTQARQSQQIAQKQVQLLSRLQVTMSQFRPEREFFPAIWEESRFRLARTESFQRLAEVENLLGQIRASLEPNAMSQMQTFLTAFEAEVGIYREELESILGRLDPETIDAAMVDRVEQQVSDFVNGPIYLRMFRFSDELTEFVEQAEERDLQANLALDRAEQLRTQIILGSMMLSIAIASLLSIYTSRAITRPIKKVTAVAKQVTERDDFSLRAPVTTQDEVGVLAIALSFYLQLTHVEIAIIGLTTGAVLTMELLNTALESVVDLTVKQSYHELAKTAKDCAAGAVLISALAALLVAGFLILPPLIEKIQSFV